jgi:hypothetical protein
MLLPLRITIRSLLLAALALALTAAPAGAVFAGQNGTISFESLRNGNWTSTRSSRTGAARRGSPTTLRSTPGRSGLPTEEDRVREPAGRQPRDLRDERRRVGADATHRLAGAGPAPVVVARRRADRVHEPPRERLGRVRDAGRWDGAEAADRPPRNRRVPGLVPGWDEDHLREPEERQLGRVRGGRRRWQRGSADLEPGRRPVPEVVAGG